MHGSGKMYDLSCLLPASVQSVLYEACGVWQYGEGDSKGTKWQPQFINSLPGNLGIHKNSGNTTCPGESMGILLNQGCN